MDYKKAGVDIEAGYKSVELMKKHVKRDHASRSTGRHRWLLRSIFLGVPFKDMEHPDAAVRHRWCRNQAEAGIFNGQA